jgi:hypothetical protein
MGRSRTYPHYDDVSIVRMTSLVCFKTTLVFLIGRVVKVVRPLAHLDVQASVVYGYYFVLLT